MFSLIAKIFERESSPCITKEEVRIQIFSSLAIITGALSLKSLSPKNSIENE